jgi:hypothetical protein
MTILENSGIINKRWKKSEKVGKTASCQHISKTAPQISNEMHVCICAFGTQDKAVKKLKSVDVQKCYKNL